MAKRECPACAGSLESARKISARIAKKESAELAAVVARGRSLLITCSLVYVATSAQVSWMAFSATGDSQRLVVGAVRLAIGLVGIWLISRGSFVTAKIAIGLMFAAGAYGVFSTVGERDPFGIAMRAILTVTFLLMAVRLSTSAPFWTYVREQRRRA